MSQAAERKLKRAERASSIVGKGLAVADGLLLLGQAVPLLSNVCSVAREVLEVVQSVKDKVDDIVEAGQRVLDVLQLLELLARNVDRLRVGKEEVEPRMRELQEQLSKLRDAIAAFGNRGWLKRAYNTWKKAKALSHIDAEMKEKLEMLMRFYSVARDAHVEQLLEERTYALEAAIATQVHRRVQEVGGSEEDAAASLERDEKAVRALAEEVGVVGDELKAELDAFRGEMHGRFDEQREQLNDLKEMMSALSSQGSGEELYRYDPYDSDDDDQEKSQLGEGAFGATHSMRSKFDGQLYAVKMIKVKKAGMPLEQLATEATRLRLLNHPHVRFASASVRT